MKPHRHLAAATALLLIVGACGRGEAGGQGAAAPVRVASVDGFRAPESVRYDPEQDVYFVSNIDGNPSTKDGNGFISRLSPDGEVRDLRWIDGARSGVELNAPKGMALQGETLWVADVDVLRAFDRRTGAPLATVEVAGATFLNDLATAPDGALYVTDSGIRVGERGEVTHPGANRIYRVRGREASVAAEGEELAVPNGIAPDASGRFWLAPMGSDALQRWLPGAAPAAAVRGPGGFDGVEPLGDGRVLVTSWADSALHVVRGERMEPLIRGLPSPADPGVDTRRGRVAVPLLQEGRLEIWTLPRRGR